jgi:hypothetical protein
VDSTSQVSKLIKSLTEDEDRRQDLWVHFLSGNPPSTFVSYLDKINKEFSIESELQEDLWQAFKNPPSDKFSSLLTKLSDIERSIVCLLALGLTVGEISAYKGISQVRIRQVIEVIRYNSAWKEIYGTKETTDRRGTLRSKR